MDLVIPKHIEKKYPDYKKKLACWEKKYFVIVKPTEIGYKKGGHPVTLIIDFDGTKKYGKEIYEFGAPISLEEFKKSYGDDINYINGVLKTKEAAEEMGLI